MTHFEIIAAPFTLWLAPVATAFPLLSAAPGAGWTKVGTSGDRNYSDDGVTVAHSQTLETARPAGATGAVKAWRTEEELVISLTLWDMTLEQYAAALNGNAVATTAAGTGTIGTKTIGLSQGREVTAYALLARGPSAYDDGFLSQYQVPRCYQSGNPQPVFSTAGPAGLELEFTALEDLAAAVAEERFGKHVVQHQAAI